MSTLKKYSRTPHLPWSLGTTDDDVKCSSLDHFNGKEIVVTEKMDGENCTWTRDACHARSLDSNNHPSRDYVRRMWAERKFDIPDNMRICGENLYATHSIHYTDLESYFQVFGIYTIRNGVWTCLSWESTKEWCKLLDLSYVREFSVGLICYGNWEDTLIQIMKNYLENMEGYVIRNQESFPESEFHLNVAKYVRANHVQTDEHWMNKKIVPNQLTGKKW